MKKIILILTASIILLFFVSCEKDQNGNRVSYYKTTGEGYLFDGTNNKPLKGVKIMVVSLFHEGSDCWFPPCGTSEIFTTDENGYYQIRFAKRLKNSKIGCYRLNILAAPSLPFLYYYSSTNEPLFHQEYFYPEDIKDKTTITFDTIKYYRTNYN
jgi:hypothetical protein